MERPFGNNPESDYQYSVQALVEAIRVADQNMMGIVRVRKGNLLFDALGEIARTLNPQRIINVIIVLSSGREQDQAVQTTLNDIVEQVNIRGNSSVVTIEEWQLTRPPISLN